MAVIKRSKKPYEPIFGLVFALYSHFKGFTSGSYSCYNWMENHSQLWGKLRKPLKHWLCIVPFWENIWVHSERKCETSKEVEIMSTRVWVRVWIKPDIRAHFSLFSLRRISCFWFGLTTASSLVSHFHFECFFEHKAVDILDRNCLREFTGFGKSVLVELQNLRMPLRQDSSTIGNFQNLDFWRG